MARWLPGAASLRSYDRSWLRGDLLGGLTVGAYAIPQVMAYAQIAGLSAGDGLLTLVAALLAYVLIGSSKRLSVGPESTTALMTAAAVAPVLATLPPERRGDATALLALLVAGVALVGWLLRLGFLARLLSTPVMVGYLVGICLLMIGSQLGKVTGLPVTGGTLPEQVLSLAGQVGRTNLAALGLATAMVVGLFVLRRVAPRLPGPLVAMVVAAALVAWLRLPVAVIGPVAATIPMPHLPNLTGLDVRQLLAPAIGVALVAYSDNILTAKAFDERHGDRVDAGHELLALGATNLVAGLAHGFPVSSSGSRTALGDSMGVRTQLSSVTVVATVVVAVLLAGPLLAAFPVAALGGLVVYAAFRLIDVAGIRRLARFRWTEVALAAVTAVAVVATDVLVGILIAVALSAVDLLRRLADPRDAILGFVPGVPGMHDIDDYPTATTEPGLLIYRYDSPLFFANADHFADKARQAVADESPVRWFVLNAEAVSEIDVTACDELERLRAELTTQGIVFGLARVKHELYEQLERAGFIAAVGPEHVYATLPTAVAAYRAAFPPQGS